MTDTMDGLARSLALNKVPDNWTKVAYFSKKPLISWFADLIDRITQLQTWTSEMYMPKSLWIAGLFNPMSFLTAIMQATARLKNLPLDDVNYFESFLNF
jgi:dynein heavy chain, axonemal